MTGTGKQEERLERLEEDITQQRRDLADQTGLDEGAGREPRFIDEGEVGEQYVDDTIAPPG